MICGSKLSIPFGRKPLPETGFKKTRTSVKKRHLVITRQKVGHPEKCDDPESKARN